MREQNYVVPSASYFYNNLIASSVASKRRTVKHRPQSSFNYTGGQTIIFKLPSESYLDTRCSYILYQLVLNSTADKTSFLGSNSLISRLVIKDGSSQIIEDINNYHYIHRLITLAMAPSDQDNSKEILYGSGREFMVSPEVTGNANGATSNGKYFILTLDLSGIFSNYKYIPLKRLENGLYVEITLSKNTDVLLSSAAGKTYELRDVQFVCDMIDFDDTFEKSLDEYLKQMPLELYFHTYSNHYFALSGASNSVVVSDKSSSLKDVYMCMTNDLNTSGADSYKLNSYQFTPPAPQFSVSLQIGNERIPSNPLTTAVECYTELLKSFNTLDDLVLRGQLNRTRYTSGKAPAAGTDDGECVSFVMGLNLEAHVGASNTAPNTTQLVLSGRDSKSVTQPMYVQIDSSVSLAGNTLQIWTHKDAIYSVDSYGKGVISY